MKIPWKTGTMEIGVYGLGRFGSFFSSLLSKHWTVKVYSRNPDRLAPDGTRRVSEEELLCLPVLVLCVAISSLKEVLRRITPKLKPGALVMDTCSVKVLPVTWMEEILPPTTEILATHPMFGPDSARNGVSGLPLILSPVRIGSTRLAGWRSYFSSLGLNVYLMDPHVHDREAAFTQGLTHYIGRVLADLNLQDSQIASVGYQKLLEIIEQTCNDSRQLFLDLQQYNPYTGEMRRVLNRSLERIDACLDASRCDEHLDS